MRIHDNNNGRAESVYHRQRNRAETVPIRRYERTSKNWSGRDGVCININKLLKTIARVCLFVIGV